MSKFKAFADNKINVATKMKFGCGRSRVFTIPKSKTPENIVGKGENAVVTCIFIFSCNVFYHMKDKFYHFFVVTLAEALMKMKD